MKKILFAFFVLSLLIPRLYADATFVPSQASEIDTSTTNFNTNLSSADNTVQKALDTLDDAAGGSGDSITVNTTAATNANFLDNIYTDWAIDTAATPDDITSKFNYAETLAGNPALLVDECIFFKDASGGGFLCEGSTADTAEQIYRFPDLNGSDTDQDIVLDDATQTLTNKTLAAADNVIAADTAVALAANGANCSSGNYPLGVDASGAVESCTAAATDTNAVKEYWWPASASLPLEVSDSIPPINKVAGTNIDQLTIAFDDSTDECRTVNFKVPSDVQSGSTITFRIHWFSSSATTGNIIWDTRHNSGVAEGGNPDSALTTIAAAADAVQGTTGQITVTTWTETLANLGWAANEQVDAEFCRDANNASDTLVGDSQATGFGVEIPRA